MAYAAFAVGALYANRQDFTLDFSGHFGAAKAVVWLALLGFLAYSVYCSRKEHFFRSARAVVALHWGRQISADLYLGLFIGLLVITLHEGVLVALLWLVPILIYANLAMLLYLAINFDGIATKLLGL